MVATRAKHFMLNDRTARIYRKLKGARGVDDNELWQHARFFALTPDQRCDLSLKTARSVLSSKRFAQRA